MTAPANGTHQDNGHILHNLMMFGETLRKIGLDVGSGNMLDLVRALEYTPIGRKQDFQQAARSILVHRKQDIVLFDEAFQVFWRRPASGQTTRDLRSLGEQRRYRNPQVAPPRGGDDGHGSATEGDEDDAGDRVDLTRTYSAREVLRQKDFSDFDGLEIAEAKRVMSDLSWDLGNRRTRRTAPGDGSWIDLEMLGNFQITIPELGTYKAVHPPIVIITSNRTREVHDALKRRCLYYWIEYPDFQKELQIITDKIPEAPRQLAQQVTGFIQELRETELYKIPGVSETLDWTSALLALNQSELDPQVIDDTMGIVLKYQDDIEMVRGEPVRAMLERSKNRGPRRGRRGGGGGGP